MRDGAAARGRSLGWWLLAQCLTRETLSQHRGKRSPSAQSRGSRIGLCDRGESVTVTRQGKPVAELRPITAAGISAATLLERWHSIPVLDLAALRSDLDEVLDSTL